MAALNQLKLPVASAAAGVPQELWGAFNALYLQLSNLGKLIDACYPVMQSPNGHFWVATISNVGVITWTDVGTVRP